MLKLWCEQKHTHTRPPARIQMATNALLALCQEWDQNPKMTEGQAEVDEKVDWKTSLTEQKESDETGIKQSDIEHEHDGSRDKCQAYGKKLNQHALMLRRIRTHVLTTSMIIVIRNYQKNCVFQNIYIQMRNHTHVIFVSSFLAMQRI